MTEIVDFINQVASAQAKDASESLDNLLSQRAFQGLDDKKTEIAKDMFADINPMTQDEINNPDEINQNTGYQDYEVPEVEVQDTADAEPEFEEEGSHIQRLDDTQHF
jgi:hypothetical protein|tara:strand:+ start:4388 stop:4708 length:321 start_codon:yes stop_codon:yes gene_type:complete